MTTAAEPTGESLESTHGIPRRFWIGLVAAVIYVLVAAGFGTLLTAVVPTDDAGAEFALGHYLPLAILIVGGVVFVRRAGWSAEVWRTPAAFETRPRRWWMLGFPVLLVAQVVIILAQTGWAFRGVGLTLIVLVGTAMVGVGEELYFRGILRASLRSHHGETVTLLSTSLLFGLAHTFGSVLAGLPVGFIALQVFGTSLDGALYYGAFRATGRLWVPMVLHAATDFSLYISSSSGANRAMSDAQLTPTNGYLEIALWIFAAVLLVSSIRQDVAARRERREGQTQPAGQNIPSR